tara:strand:- start:409 stop:561 length:153 start_codon:yes stop_codon:yes gene_type:complete
MNDDDDRVSRLTGILRMQAHLLHGVADRLHAAHPEEAGAVINAALSEYGK